MGCCCWTLPIGNNPKTQFNTMRMDPDGTVVWQVDWDAIKGENSSQMTVFNRSVGFTAAGRALDQYAEKLCMHVLDDAYLVAVGVKDGTLHVASLNISDGTEYLSLTDSTESIDPSGSGNAQFVSTHSVVVAGTPDKIVFYHVESIGTGQYGFYKWEIEADGTTTKSTIGTITQNDTSATPAFVYAEITNDGDAILLVSETVQFSNASSDYLQLLDSHSNLDQYAGKQARQPFVTNDGKIYFNLGSAGPSGTIGWHYEELPLVGSFTLVGNPSSTNQPDFPLLSTGWVGDNTFAYDAQQYAALFDASEANGYQWRSAVGVPMLSLESPPTAAVHVGCGWVTNDNAYWWMMVRTTESSGNITLGANRYDRSGNVVSCSTRTPWYAAILSAGDYTSYTESDTYLITSHLPSTTGNGQTGNLVTKFSVINDAVLTEYQYKGAPIQLYTQDSSGDHYFANANRPVLEISGFGLNYDDTIVDIWGDVLESLTMTMDLQDDTSSLEVETVTGIALLLSGTGTSAIYGWDDNSGGVNREFRLSLNQSGGVWYLVYSVHRWKVPNEQDWYIEGTFDLDLSSILNMRHFVDQPYNFLHDGATNNAVPANGTRDGDFTFTCTTYSVTFN